MSIQSRLDKLENPSKAKWCTHQPMRLFWGNTDGTPADPLPSNEQPCFCGRPGVLLVVEYGEQAQRGTGSALNSQASANL